MTLQRLCQDCAHCYVPYTYHPGEPGMGWEERHWHRAACRLTVDYVTGGRENLRLCSDERNDVQAHACGPAGIYFEAKPPPPPRPLPPPSFWDRFWEALS